VNGKTIEALAQEMLGKHVSALDQEEARVLRTMAERMPVSLDAGELAEQSATFWDRLADRVAAIGGSWPFIFGFLGVLVAWMLLNTDVLSRWGVAFDPYPYIFLNLMLSMLAAIQAPIIMMSQNRAAEKDRIAAAHDYEVNLRAELEILALHKKIDALREDLLARFDGRSA
jgi:uncharacterized membrane protein